MNGSEQAAGNSGADTLTVTYDITLPTVALTAPTAGATVSGTITVSATASDNFRVAGVQFKLDGSNLGTEVTVAPYSVAWSTFTTVNGAHTLTAVARDPAGNRTASASVGVVVANASTGAVVAYWKLDEGTGTIAGDATGHGNVGTLLNGPSWIAGKHGQALAFDGLASSVRVPSTSALNSYPLTIAFWVRVPDDAGLTEAGPIMALEDGAPVEISWNRDPTQAY